MAYNKQFNWTKFWGEVLGSELNYIEFDWEESSQYIPKQPEDAGLVSSGCLGIKPKWCKGFSTLGTIEPGYNKAFKSDSQRLAFFIPSLGSGFRVQGLRLSG